MRKISLPPEGKNFQGRLMLKAKKKAASLCSLRSPTKNISSIVRLFSSSPVLSSYPSSG